MHMGHITDQVQILTGKRRVIEQSMAGLEE